MPRNINRDQELRKERTNDILKHAVELFAQKGLEATKISDIAKKAGMSHGLIYNYFKSKEEIYASLIHLNLISFKEQLEELYQTKSPKELLEGIVRDFDKRKWNEAGFHYFFVEQIINSDAVNLELKEALNRDYDEVLAFLSKIFKEGMENGEFLPGVPEYHAHYFLTVLQGTIVFSSKKLPQNIYGYTMLSYLYQ
ncbi:TetR/AcrR family transcriptional regulator [Paenibacillus sp. FSL R10-2734]|uniref:TetR/AcrR family transcriptional regulator n=1 Tax=Paenibacillus sp. FSL R10-2734 TaxID=2954691 RepID=UPI0030D8AE55